MSSFIGRAKPKNFGGFFRFSQTSLGLSSNNCVNFYNEISLGMMSGVLPWLTIPTQSMGNTERQGMEPSGLWEAIPPSRRPSSFDENEKCKRRYISIQERGEQFLYRKDKICIALYC